MDIAEFKKLKVGDKVYIVHDTGVGGIGLYQYIGKFKYHFTYHVFLNETLSRTVCIRAGLERISRYHEMVFTDKANAILKVKELLLAKNQSKLEDEDE